MMGSPETEEGRDDDEGPVHKVCLSSLLIAKFEVSQAEWKQVMGTEPSHFKGENLPVEQISWGDCKEFCKKTGLKLPTEAQWEYACRAGADGPYWETGKLADMGWYGVNSLVLTTHAVGKKKPIDFGLHDMHGNVWEWCEDIVDIEFYSKPEASMQDPICTSGSDVRVVRGGSWGNGAGGCRSACRAGRRPSIRGKVMGFRPAWSPSP